MKKKLLALLTAGLLLSSGTGVHAEAYSEQQMRIADALYHVELFRGTNKGYELGRELNRVEGITLLVRLLGKEEDAMSRTYNLPFADVDDWAKPYVGYAYENGITNGVSDTKFGSQNTMTDYMFITLILRALGYTDQGDAPQFAWNSPYVLADEIGLIDTAMADTFFSRGDAVEVFWNALAGNDYEMAKTLRDSGVFTADELEDAIDIYHYGKETLQTSGTDTATSDNKVVTQGDNSSNDSGFDWEEWEDWIELENNNSKPSDKNNNTSDKNEKPGSGSSNTGNSGSGNNNTDSGSGENTSGGSTTDKDTTTDNNNSGNNTA